MAIGPAERDRASRPTGRVAARARMCGAGGRHGARSRGGRGGDSDGSGGDTTQLERTYAHPRPPPSRASWRDRGVCAGATGTTGHRQGSEYRLCRSGGVSRLGGSPSLVSRLSSLRIRIRRAYGYALDMCTCSHAHVHAVSRARGVRRSGGAGCATSMATSHSRGGARRSSVRRRDPDANDRPHMYSVMISEDTRERRHRSRPCLAFCRLHRTFRAATSV